MDTTYPQHMHAALSCYQLVLEQGQTASLMLDMLTHTVQKTLKTQNAFPIPKCMNIESVWEPSQSLTPMAIETMSSLIEQLDRPSEERSVIAARATVLLTESNSQDIAWAVNEADTQIRSVAKFVTNDFGFAIDACSENASLTLIWLAIQHLGLHEQIQYLLIDEGLDTGAAVAEDLACMCLSTITDPTEREDFKFEFDSTWDALTDVESGDEEL